MERQEVISFILQLEFIPPTTNMANQGKDLQSHMEPSVQFIPKENPLSPEWSKAYDSTIHIDQVTDECYSNTINGLEWLPEVQQSTPTI